MADYMPMPTGAGHAGHGPIGLNNIGIAIGGGGAPAYGSHNLHVSNSNHNTLHNQTHSQSQSQSSSDNEAVNQCRRQILDLRNAIMDLRKHNEGNATALSSRVSGSGSNLNLSVRRVLKGHFQKLVSLSICPEDPHLLLSAAQDGKLILWNTLLGTKTLVISLQSCWVLSCSFSPTGNSVVSGGLDNSISLYNLPLPAGSNKEDYNKPPNATFSGHEGYISSLKFLNSNTLISTSGDRSVIVWDVPSVKSKQTLLGHTGDIMCGAISHNSDSPLIVTGSTDRSVSVWDIRQNPKHACISSFTHEHNGDVNSVTWSPQDSNCFATACDDGRLRIFDLRASAMLQAMNGAGPGQNQNDSNRDNSSNGHGDHFASITTTDFSATGSYLFSGNEEGIVCIWDVCRGRLISSASHDNTTVSAVTATPNGKAFVSASWDCTAKVWTGH